MVIEERKGPDKWLIWLIVFVIMLAWSIRGCSQNVVKLDTIVCHIEYIDKFVKCPTANGKSTKIYAVYNDKKNEISELIPVSKSVYQYIEICRTNGIAPNLGIKLRNGQISTIIRYRHKFIKRN